MRVSRVLHFGQGEGSPGSDASPGAPPGRKQRLLEVRSPAQVTLPAAAVNVGCPLGNTASLDGRSGTPAPPGLRPVTDSAGAEHISCLPGDMPGVVPAPGFSLASG